MSDLSTLWIWEMLRPSSPWIFQQSTEGGIAFSQTFPVFVE